MMVEELFGKLGIKIDKASWDRANNAIQGMGKALSGVMSKVQNWGRGLQGTLVKAAAGWLRQASRDRPQVQRFHRGARNRSPACWRSLRRPT
jgi:hypothetical protein